MGAESHYKTQIQEHIKTAFQVFVLDMQVHQDKDMTSGLKDGSLLKVP